MEICRIMFDPYHKWLGISPKDQPPNYYRLLGIDLFESDIDVISHAADQRMSHVKAFSLKYKNESQKILNEISRARVVLSNPVAKKSYDESLHIGASGLLPPGPVNWKNWSGMGAIREQAPVAVKLEPLPPLVTENVLQQVIRPIQSLPTKKEQKPSKVWGYLAICGSIFIAPFILIKNISKSLQSTIEKPRAQSPWMTFLAILGMGILALFLTFYSWSSPMYLNPNVKEDVFVALKLDQTEPKIFEILGRPTKTTYGTRYKFTRMGDIGYSYILTEDESFSSYLYIYQGENSSEEIRILFSPDRKLLSAVYLYKGYPLGYTGLRDDKCPSITQNSFNLAREDVETLARKSQLENFFVKCGVKN
jgi:hypothetical protein